MLRNETCKRSVSFWVKSVNKSHIPFKIPSALHHIAWENGRHFAMQPLFCPRYRNFFARFSDVMSRGNHWWHQRVLDPSLPRTSNRGLGLPVCGSTFKHNSIQIGGGLKNLILVYFSIQKQKKYQSVKVKEIYGNTGSSSSKEL